MSQAFNATSEDIVRRMNDLVIGTEVDMNDKLTMFNNSCKFNSEGVTGEGVLLEGKQ